MFDFCELERTFPQHGCKDSRPESRGFAASAWSAWGDVFRPAEAAVGKRGTDALAAASRTWLTGDFYSSVLQYAVVV